MSDKFDNSGSCVCSSQIELVPKINLPTMPIPSLMTMVLECLLFMFLSTCGGCCKFQLAPESFSLSITGHLFPRHDPSVLTVVSSCTQAYLYFLITSISLSVSESIRACALRVPPLDTPDTSKMATDEELEGRVFPALEELVKAHCSLLILGINLLLERTYKSIERK
jgi:hypothetical protein